jgi:outer membrane lipoprotein-sorting protein
VSTESPEPPAYVIVIERSAGNQEYTVDPSTLRITRLVKFKHDEVSLDIRWSEMKTNEGVPDRVFDLRLTPPKRPSPAPPAR